MSTPTFKLPPGYASMKWGAPSGLTEATTMLGAAVIKALSYSNAIERIKVEGASGFVAGWVDMKATPNAGSGGTKFDTERLTVSCVHGEHATKTWPAVTDVVTISGCAGDDAKLNGDWSIVSENSTFARKTEADKGYELERYCDIDLTP
jgi:hypothetical protein